jgi:hypothetical protein
MSVSAGFSPPESVLSELRMTEPAHLDMEVIAWHCGATVVYEPVVGCEAYIIGRQERAIITVNERSPRPRQRFSIGHELGHWMRDRGTIGFSCDKRKLSPQRRAEGPEHLANVYAADLLLPLFMFVPRAKNQPVTFETVRALASEFQTSLTSTAIRLVQYGSFPAIVLYTEPHGRSWLVRGPDVPSFLKLHDEPSRATLAYDLLRGRPVERTPLDVYADGWFEHDDADRYTIREDSIPAGAGVLTILWWKDEGQLLALDSE